jgi:serine/threonine protein phosphatase PrpC
MQENRGNREDGDGPGTRSGAALVLADGAGGHDAGDIASYIATTTVAAELAPVAARTAAADPEVFGVDLPRDPPDDREIEAAIEAAVEEAHRRILERAAETGTGAYTTVVAAVVARGRLHYGWVGDSRAYVCNAAHGEVTRLTADHAVVEQLYAAGDLDEVEAAVHPRGNEITRALGGSGDPGTATVEVATGSVPLFAEDTVLLTSDGLPDAQTDAPALYDRYVEGGRDPEAAERVRERILTDADIGETVLGADSPAAAADRLIERANDRGGKDNLSVIVCRDPTLPGTPDRLPVRGGDPHPAYDRETVVEE